MDQTFEKRKKVILDFISDDMYVPMKIKEIAIVLQIPREQRDDLKEVLDVLVEEGKISLSKRGKYSKGQAVRLKGVFQANARGFGFVTPEDGAEDVFIPERNVVPDESLTIAGESLFFRGVHEFVDGKVGDLPMADSDQVFDELGHAEFVVRGDERTVESQIAAVQKDHRYFPGKIRIRIGASVCRSLSEGYPAGGVFRYL